MYTPLKVDRSKIEASRKKKKVVHNVRREQLSQNTIAQEAEGLGGCAYFGDASILFQLTIYDLCV